MSWYVGSPPTLVRKGIGKEDLMFVTLKIVLENRFLWWSMVVSFTLCGSADKKIGLGQFLKFELGSDGLVCNLKSPILRG